MNTSRSKQLIKMRTLYELREREALIKLHQQKKSVDLLKITAKEIQDCVNGFVLQLKTLDDRRLHEHSLTVDMLQEDAASRLIVQRDLGKEHVYLNTALKDIKEAMGELAVRRSQWREHANRLDALTTLEKKQKQLEVRLAQVVIDRELDDLAANRHGAIEHG